MRPRTREALEAASKWEWFSRIGQKDSSRSDILWVDNWENATRFYESGLQDEFMNAQIGLQIKRFRESHGENGLSAQRNEVVAEIRAAVDQALALERIGATEVADVPQSALDIVAMDLKFYLLEVEYSDIVKPDIFSQRAQWYERGHFVCGNEGIYEVGRFIIY